MRFISTTAPALASLCLTTLAAPHGPQPEKRQISSLSANSAAVSAADRQAAVKEAFSFAWNGYYQHAFPHDELHPIANSFSDSRYTNQNYTPRYLS